MYETVEKRIKIHLSTGFWTCFYIYKNVITFLRFYVLEIDL